MTRLLALVLGCTLAAGSIGAAVAAADDSSELEMKVKAAYLYNFAKFVDWGTGKLAAAETSIEICVNAPEPFPAIVDDTVRGKRVGGHPLVVRRVDRNEDLSTCHILYAASHDERALGLLFSATAGSGVMTIHEADDPLPAGVARLYLEENRVRFEINVAAAEREHLQISSKLLSVASVVQR